ncbi:MAG: hypothetical protein HY359_14295 [Candidatus Rokubacteria bacterium]|nr:hypothetical protein [Candidatus Rokubacteria bacterium]
MAPRPDTLVLIALVCLAVSVTGGAVAQEAGPSVTTRGAHRPAPRG